MRHNIGSNARGSYISKNILFILITHKAYRQIVFGLVLYGNQIRDMEAEFIIDIISWGMFGKGSFNNYVDRILPFFDPPSLRGQFLIASSSRDP